jgi:hypothetical protein
MRRSAKITAAILLPTAALAQVTKEKVHEAVFLPERKTFFFQYPPSMNPDCSIIGTVVVRILKPPKNGQLRVEEGSVYPNFPPENVRSKCNATAVTGVRISYEAPANFKGRETAEIEAIYPTGSYQKVRFVLIVK